MRVYRCTIAACALSRTSLSICCIYSSDATFILANLEQLDADADADAVLLNFRQLSPSYRVSKGFFLLLKIMPIKIIYTW